MGRKLYFNASENCFPNTLHSLAKVLHSPEVVFAPISYYFHHKMFVSECKFSRENRKVLRENAKALNVT